MDLKKPTTIEEQIEILIRHGVVINDKTLASDILSQIGYYRLSGYLIQFRKSKNDSYLCRTVSFDELLGIISFDTELRNYIWKYIEIEEVFYKALISNMVSIKKCSKPPYNQHCDVNNYYSKENVLELLNKIEKNKKYYENAAFFEHHIERYNGRFPLWVIMEMISLSDASKYYKTLFYSDKEMIANVVNTKGDILSNHLHCISMLRNKCAHTARLYNVDYNPPVKLGSTFLRKNPSVKNNTLFAYIIVLNKRLPNDEYRNEFVNGLEEIIEKYKEYIDLEIIGFPKNYKEVLICCNK